MKVLLLQPPVQDFYDTEARLQPLGLGYLKAALLRHLPGVAVMIRDFHHGRGRRTVPLPPELAHLREYYPYADRSPFRAFHGYYHFGAPVETVGEEVARESPDVVGISSLFSAYHREVLTCARAIRARLPSPIVIGGAHASAAPLSLLRDPAVDWVVRGEGERPLVELLRSWRQGNDLAAVPNLAWKRDGTPVLNPLGENFPLSELPLPDWRDLPPGRYRLGRRPLTGMLASRGCPHRCAFCAAHRGPGSPYRRRPAADLLAEIRTRWAEGYCAIDFEDDNLTLPRAEMVALCRGVIEEYPEGALSLSATNGVSYLSLDADLLALMRRAGFAALNLSLVSLSAEACARHGRPHDPARYREVVAAAHRLGLGVVSYQILGLPGESLASMVETLAFQARLPVLLGASPFYLAPGSPLAERRPPPTEAELVRCRLTALGFEDASRDEVYTLFVATRILNFLKGLPGLGDATPLAEALEVARRGGARAALGAELLERLLAGGDLCAATPEGPLPLPRFRENLFRALGERIGWVATLDGGQIRLSP